MKSFIKDIFAYSRNWEQDIFKVELRPCDQDPLGLEAVYYLSKEMERSEKLKSFVVGASFLDQRRKNLKKAGFKAPMTKRALHMVESRLRGARQAA